MINLEKIDYVMSASGCSFEEVREALVQTDGDVDLAIAYLKGKKTGKDDKSSKFQEKVEIFADDIVSSVKEIWKKGNASRLLVKDEKGQVLLNIPLTASLVTVALSPLLFLLGIGMIVISKAEFKLIMEDGKEIDLKDYIRTNKKSDDKDSLDIVVLDEEDKEDK